MGFLESAADTFGVDAETLEEGAALVDAGTSYAQEGAELYGDVLGAYAEGKGALEDLGLLPPPDGQAAGGRWVLDPNGSPSYLPAGSIVSGGKGIPSVVIDQLPLWIPAGMFAGEPAVRRRLMIWLALGAGQDDIDRIADMEPISGIAPPGTPFEQLPPEQQRSYVANSYAIAAATHRSNPTGMMAAVNRLKGQQDGLGWASYAGQFSQVEQPGVFGQICEGPQISADGKPIRVMICDQDEAARRLFGVLRGFGAGQGAMFAGPMQVGGEGWRECFLPGLSGADRAACIERYAGDPGLAAFMSQIGEPWKDYAIPGKILQVVDGTFGKSWTVLEIGGTQKGYRSAFFWPVTGALALGSIATAAIGYWTTQTKKGRRWKKRLFK